MTLPSSGPLSLSDIQGEFGGSNPIGLNEYYAGGGLVPAGTTGTYGAVPTSGQISVQNFYGTSNYIPVYIEELFSTYVYDGNSSVRSIQNGINLASNGGLVWVKRRNVGEYHILTDTVRGANKQIFTDLTAVQSSTANQITGFNSDGFSLGADTSFGWTNLSSFTYASWTFRKQAKFFDVVTYTGDGSNRTIAHNLGSVPGCIIVKRTDVVANWQVYHRSLANTEYLVLNSTAAKATGTTRWNSTTPTSTVFSLGTDTTVNASGGTYVAYLFAHDAGGFGLSGSDNVISCGSYTGISSSDGPIVTLGYEPQWVMIKDASYGTANWLVYDNMRGWPVGSNPRWLYPNTSAAEVTDSWGRINLTATGFQIKTTDYWLNQPGDTYIYIAIRRGPMKVPTSGTSVFSPVRQAGGGTVTTNFVVDASITKDIAVAAVGDNFVWDRLRGSVNGALAANNLITNSTAAESAGSVSAAVMNVSNTAVTDSFYGSGYNVIYWNFRRAPGFFDEVCYTGTGAFATVNHNLGVSPELMIGKKRNSTGDWYVFCQYMDATPQNYYQLLNTTAAKVLETTNRPFNLPNETVLGFSATSPLNASGSTYVTYLFASCPGVSKVGSYTGTGALQTVNCGFTGGARFVLIKRTDSTGGWYIYDSARGISSGNDPYLLLNSTAAEVTGTNYVDTTSVGFQVTAAAPAGLNANGGTYIFLAIA